MLLLYCFACLAQFVNHFSLIRLFECKIFCSYKNIINGEKSPVTKFCHWPARFWPLLPNFGNEGRARFWLVLHKFGDSCWRRNPAIGYQNSGTFCGQFRLPTNSNA
jgi:hypothetical protein